jgi:hypothetical protein
MPSRRKPPATPLIDVDDEPPPPKKNVGAQAAFSGAKLQKLRNALPDFRVARMRKKSKVNCAAVHTFNKNFMVEWIKEFDVQVDIHDNNAKVFVETIGPQEKDEARITRADVIRDMRGVSGVLSHLY